MVTSRTEVLERIRLIARRELDYREAIELEHSLRHDLELDSMAMIVVAVGLENHYRIRLQEEDAGKIATVGDLVTLVCLRVSEQRAQGSAP